MLCCPNCRSLEIYVEAGGMTGNIYHCKKCGYRGAFVLEIERDEGTGDVVNEPLDEEEEEGEEEEG
jgi:DNA-directed RNA polymerase subunit M/transcription elongation factor TFIIS